VIRVLLGHCTCCAVILAIRLSSWTDTLLFDLFDRVLKECHPPVVKEMSRQKKMLTTTTFLFAMTARVVTNTSLFLSGSSIMRGSNAPEVAITLEVW
jgi:hypothetical protein